MKVSYIENAGKHAANHPSNEPTISFTFRFHTVSNAVFYNIFGEKFVN